MGKILIIGTNSFIGRNYINFSKNKIVSEVSLFDMKPEEINFSDVDAIIHLVAIVHQSKKIPESEYNKINRDLAVSVAACAKKAGVRQFVFLSTVKVYGDNHPGPWPLNENSICTPGDSYGKSKLEAEISLRKMEDENFIVSIIRTPLVYGKGVKANMLSILKLVDKFTVLPLAGISNKRSMTFVENLIGYIDRIIETRCSGVFIAMDIDAISTTDLVKNISKNLQKKIFLFQLPKVLLRPLSVFFPSIISRLFESLEFDNRKTLRKLDYYPPFKIEEGIKKMVTDYKKGLE